jgi:hypothetical protein
MEFQDKRLPSEESRPLITGLVLPDKADDISALTTRICGNQHQHDADLMRPESPTTF